MTVLIVRAFTGFYYRTVRIRRLSILGLGLMGGSVALAMRKTASDCVITGYDIDPSVGRRARRRGIVDRAVTRPADAAEGAELIVLAAPLSGSIKLLSQISGFVGSATLVTDVCSTKASIQAAAAELLPDRFVGSHPMAGRQHKGLDHADGTIFRKSLCILTPSADAPAIAVRRVEQFWRRLGMKTIRLNPAEHDRRMAFASHLPQAVASALMAVQSTETLAVAGKGLADTTRLAASPGRLWAEILLDNRRPVLDALAAMRSALGGLEAAVRKGDRRAIERVFARAAGNRRALERRQAPDPGGKA